MSTEAADYALWYGRHRRLAIRCFGPLSNQPEFELDSHELCVESNNSSNNSSNSNNNHNFASDRPDILPTESTSNVDNNCRHNNWRNSDFNAGEFVERKATVAHMLMTSLGYLIAIFHKPNTNQSNSNTAHHLLKRRQRQWSRSFAPSHVQNLEQQQQQLDVDGVDGDLAETLAALIEEEVFFDNPSEATTTTATTTASASGNEESVERAGLKQGTANAPLGVEAGVYLAERHHNGWRTSALNGLHLMGDSSHSHASHPTNHLQLSGSNRQNQNSMRNSNSTTAATNRGNRIAAQLLDGVLENSRRPQMQRIKYFGINDLDDRNDHRPFFTYWINTVQIVVLFLSIICYGIAPIGFGTEQKTGQVLVTSLSLQTVQHVEQRNLWIGPRNNDLVHMGAKFAACMRRDVKIMEVVTKTRRQERETACCIRNDDSGCVQSSQADCSIRGLYPTKSISTWKKWSPGESGPGGRISGSVCGLDPKFCDAPASIVPYEWPDDITKWPICRKTNSFSQRYRYKDHTAEHMVCEVIGHPCCTGLYGECRITTREYCDFVNGYFHEEASLCSQISCLNNVCGMFPFISVEIPDQIYRVLTSLCMHAGVLHLAITLIFQHLFLADLERLIGTLRTTVVYIMSGLAGNLTSAVLVPHRPEVGPSASLCGVVSSLVALLIWMHWKHLHKPYVALFKLLLLCTVLFGIGTLPYQLNFAGLLAGVACGAFITISLVPFATFTKYGRRKKINLIWTCFVFHLFVCATLIAIFYIHPSEFSTFNFVDDVFGGGNKGYTSATNSNIGHHNGDVSTTTRRYSQTQKPQYYYHHHSEDIIRNGGGAFTEENMIAHIFPDAQRQKSVQLWQKGLYSRAFSYNSNSSSSYGERIYKNMQNSPQIANNKDNYNNKTRMNYQQNNDMHNNNNTKFKGL
ncbi:GH23944 [Drosophila grimshawi]|uniref:GH23944 n=2 Tax=Drosophila grimshawi TaxID=7222 RepID=B4JZS8_DROGR|nr:GH23944 [Drosophila grimshawi]